MVPKKISVLAAVAMVVWLIFTPIGLFVFLGIGFLIFGLSTALAGERISEAWILLIWTMEVLIPTIFIYTVIRRYENKSPSKS